MYLSLRKRDFFCPNRKHVKSAGLLLFWRIWRARCFPWDSVSKSTNWHLPEQGEMESALSPSVLSRAPEVPAAADCTQCPLVVTPGGRRGRKKGHVVCAVGCLTAAGLVKLFFWELLVHLAFKYSLCFSFFFFPEGWERSKLSTVLTVMDFSSAVQLGGSKAVLRGVIYL